MIALHFEFKIDGGIGALGPGDTLRLAHALRKPACGVDAVITAAPQILSPLIPQHIALRSLCSTTRDSRSGRVRQSVLKDLLSDYAREHKAVVHAFIGEEARQPGSKIAVQDTQLQRWRIDGTNSASSWMYHSHWVPQTARRDYTERVLAVAVRAMQVAHNLNTPFWFIRLVREVAGCRSDRDGRSVGISSRRSWFGTAC